MAVRVGFHASKCIYHKRAVPKQPCIYATGSKMALAGDYGTEVQGLTKPEMSLNYGAFSQTRLRGVCGACGVSKTRE